VTGEVPADLFEKQHWNDRQIEGDMRIVAERFRVMRRL
jgi:hypothetical protein